MKKRNYNSENRRARAQETCKRIILAAQKLFSSNGFEKTTIESISEHAGVSAPTVYAHFKSKEGILKRLVSETFFGTEYQALVEKAVALTDPNDLLKMAAHITRTIYDAGRYNPFLFGGTSVISPEMRKMEVSAAKQRYERQEFVILRIRDINMLREELDVDTARDVLWALTDHEIYRKLVQERGWSSEAFEEWLASTLIRSLLDDDPSSSKE